MNAMNPKAKITDINNHTSTLSDKDFTRLSGMIHDMVGIKLPPAKKIMLEGRLRKRMRALGMDSLEQYCRYLFDSKESLDEYVHMIDAVTTNKTGFFREPEHFHYLSRIVLPELAHSRRLNVAKPLLAWSAGCSTGEESYTLAMVLKEFTSRQTSWSFRILATDISTEVLEKARMGIYEHEKIAPVPIQLRKKYLLRSRDQSRSLVRMCPELRAHVRFERLNLMDWDYGIRDAMSIVFCRNVIIYFDRPTQARLLKQLTDHLLPGGYLFIGHSESLHGMKLPLVQKAPTIYQKTQAPEGKGDNSLEMPIESHLSSKGLHTVG